MANLIAVGCKLPQGLIIEVGYKLENGGVTRTNKYKRITLAGANQHSIIQGQMRTPSPKDLQPGITEGVDEEAFDEWMASHADTNIVKHMLVFKATSAKEAKAIAKELTTEKTGMEAVDPAKHPGIKKMTEGDGDGRMA